MKKVMQALSIQEPWITLIYQGHKTIETRTWPTTHRGPLLLVGSKKPQGPCAGLAVATCNLTDCRPMTRADEEAAQCYYEEGVYSWVLEDVKPITPFPVTGQLGLYEVKLNKKMPELELWKSTKEEEQ